MTTRQLKTMKAGDKLKIKRGWINAGITVKFIRQVAAEHIEVETNSGIHTWSIDRVAKTN